MYLDGTYKFSRIIINGNRVTIPKDVMNSNGWNIGTEIIVTFEPATKKLKGIEV